MPKVSPGPVIAKNMKRTVSQQAASQYQDRTLEGKGPSGVFTVRRILIHVALGLQRCPIMIPKWIRSPMRLLLSNTTRNASKELYLDDWSRPLLPLYPPTQDSRHDALPRAGSNSEQLMPGNVGSQCRTGPEGRQGDEVCQGDPDGLRCLLVTSALDAGGMDEVVVFLARRLPAHGIHTAVLHASETGSSDGAPTGRLGQLLLSYGVAVVELAGDTGARWLENWRPDVISAHGAPPWVLQAASRLSIPYVDTLHGMHSFFGEDHTAEAERGQQLAGIVAVSDLVRRQYLHVNPAFSPDRIVTIPNGVDDVRRTPGDRDDARARWGIKDEYVFVSLARYCLQKNAYGLVAAFEDVAAIHPEAHLVIAGRPDDALYFAQVRRLRERLPCRDRIHLRDHHPNPAELLAFADGFVLDSFFEGWSLASMEALCAGVPVVLSEVGGSREQVGDSGECGFVVPNPLGDPLQVNWAKIRETRFAHQVNRSQIVEAMSALIRNRQSSLAQRERLIRESAARFHPDVCLASHAQLLKAVADHSQLLAESRA